MKHVRYIALIVVCILLAGICAAQEEALKKVMPKKVEVDTNYDGKIDRVESYDTDGQIMKVESDTNGDGNIDEWVVYKAGKPTKSEKDTNGDGKADVWIEY
jgi:hypothetical protein